MTGARAGHGAGDLDLFPLVAASLLVLILVWMTYPAVALLALFPRGYNEGWNALVTMRAMGGLPLYPQDTTLHANNYPPLSFYIVGLLGWWVGDNIVAGRIVSLASVLAMAVEVALAVRLLRGSWPVAGFAGLVLLGGLNMFASGTYVGSDDPQVLAHAVMLGGLLVLLWRPDARGHLVAAAVLMVVAGLIKHNLLALPLAVTIWLFWQDRRGLVVWLLAAGAAVGVALLALGLLYGPAGLRSIAGVRSYRVMRMLQLTQNTLVQWQIPIVGAVLVILARPTDAASRLLACYVGCALVVAVLFAGGAGVQANMFFDLLIATSIGAGLLLQQARTAPVRHPRALHSVVAAAYVFAIGLGLPARPVLELLHASSIPKAVAETRGDLAFLGAIEGRVICETLALCYWAGKGLEVDTFNARQGFLTGQHDEQVLLDLLASGAIAAVHLQHADPMRDDERISPAFMDALLRHYRLSHVSGNGFFFRYQPP